MNGGQPAPGPQAQGPQGRPQRPMLAILSSVFGGLGLVMILFVPDTGPVAYYSIFLFLLIIATFLTGGIGFAHTLHDGQKKARRWAVIGLSLALLETLFATWAITT